MHPHYLYWDKLKYKELPDEYTPEVVWASIKFLRSSGLHRRESVVKDEKGKSFSWLTSLPWHDEFIYEIDSILKLTNNLSSRERRQFMARGVMEEAI